MTDAGRIACCIPGCRRSFRRTAKDTEGSEVICRRHWRMADTRLRDRHKQLRSRIRRLDRMWGRRHLVIERSGRYIKFAAVMTRAYQQCRSAWRLITEDVTIKSAFGAEDAPRRRSAA